MVKNTSRKKGGGGGRNEDWRFRLAVKAVTGSRVPPLRGTVVTSPTWDGYYTGDEDPWQLMAASMRSTAARKIGLHIYTERMEQYFAPNDVDAATKRHVILLTASGAATYKLIRGLVAPDKPTDRSYTELVKLVKGHYNPTPLPIVQ